MGKKRYTIKDVAHAAGLSIGTVSRFINSSGYVSKEAGEKIEKAIAQLQYFPNAAARNIVNCKSGLVGVAVPEINNPFLGDLIIKIEACLSNLGYSVIFCSTAFDPVKTENFIDDLIMRNAEGVILAAADISWSENELIQKINHFMAGVSVGQVLPNFDSVNYSDFDLGIQMAEYLISMGHQEIGCIAFTENSTQTTLRKEGVIQALRNHNLPVRKEHFIGFGEKFPYIPGENGGYLCTKRILSGEIIPTAIVAINDYSAIGAYKAIEEKKLKVGEDISIVGFDNIEMSRFVSPPMTTINCDTKELANLTTQLLHRRITGQCSENISRIILPAQIIYRNSVKKRN